MKIATLIQFDSVWFIFLTDDKAALSSVVSPHMVHETSSEFACLPGEKAEILCSWFTCCDCISLILRMCTM